MPPLRTIRRALRLTGAAALLAASLGATAWHVGRSAVATAATVLDVVARDYAFDAPDTIAAGRTLVRLRNAGTELHHVVILRLFDGKRMGDLFEAMKSLPPGALPSWAREVGGPNAPVPGGQSEAALSLDVGHYVMLCVIPAKDGMPHVMKGMARELTVVAARPASRAALANVPDPDATITLDDYSFTLSKPLAAGRHVVRVRNAARQAHEVFIAKLAPGKTAQDLVVWVHKQDGPPPAMPMGGTVGIPQNGYNDVVVDLSPGEYALLCFYPDAKDGKEHVEHGMVKQIRVN